MKTLEEIRNRQLELLNKHPEFRELIEQDPVVYKWFNNFIRTDQSIENALKDLVLHQSKLINHFKEENYKLLSQSPQPSIFIPENMKHLIK